MTRSLRFGCRTDKTETMSGYINLVMVPQYILSGIFFSSNRFPSAVQPIIQARPLTQINSSFRAVMLEGAGPASEPRPLRLTGAAPTEALTVCQSRERPGAARDSPAP